MYPHLIISRVYLYTFIALFITAVLNIFIFIIEDAFKAAKIVRILFIFLFVCFLFCFFLLIPRKVSELPLVFFLVQILVACVRLCSCACACMRMDAFMCVCFLCLFVCNCSIHPYSSSIKVFIVIYFYCVAVGQRPRGGKAKAI